MTALFAGVLLWALVHLFKSVTPAARASISRKLGDKGAQGLAALLIILSIVLMVYGWRNADYRALYDPPIWGRHLHMLTMFVAIFLFGAAYRPSKVKKLTVHPMLWGMTIWAAGHLLANGDSRSLVLFGGLGIWAVASMFTISARDGHVTNRRVPDSWKPDLIGLPITAVVYAVLYFIHPWIAGVPVMM